MGLEDEQKVSHPLHQRVREIEEEAGRNHVFVFGPDFSSQLERYPELTGFLGEGIPLSLRFLRFADELQQQHILVWLSDRNFLDHGGMIGELDIKKTTLLDAGVARVSGSVQAPALRFEGDNMIMKIFGVGDPLEIRRKETERRATEIKPENMTVTSGVTFF